MASASCGHHSEDQTAAGVAFAPIASHRRFSFFCLWRLPGQQVTPPASRLVRARRHAIARCDRLCFSLPGRPSVPAAAKKIRIDPVRSATSSRGGMNRDILRMPQAKGRGTGRTINQCTESWTHSPTGEPLRCGRPGSSSAASGAAGTARSKAGRAVARRTPAASCSGSCRDWASGRHRPTRA